MASTAHSRGIWRTTLALIFLLSSALVPTQAQTFKVLHTFEGSDGAFPVGQLVRDAVGNIYGTTGAGGTDERCSCGTVFKMNKNGKLIWLYSFDKKNGWGPSAGVLRDPAGNLFGVTAQGGGTDLCQPYGCGEVFKLSAAKKETVLHRFTSDPDGYSPESLLVEDSAGTLYGTAAFGGAYGPGAVFSVDSKGKETMLYSFTGGADGSEPIPGVIRDASGNLYGVTVIGGAYDAGAVFELDTTGKESVLYSFAGGTDGSGPLSELTADASGNLYGLTTGGGNLGCGAGAGCGVVFELSPNSDGWKETTLYVFCALSNCTDGERPAGGPLVLDRAGNLYGVTSTGGTSQCFGGSGCGVVFELDAGGKETVLHSFTGGTDGGEPLKGLTIDAAGNLYGATELGGDIKCKADQSEEGCGVVFEITP